MCTSCEPVFNPQWAATVGVVKIIFSRKSASGDADIAQPIRSRNFQYNMCGTKIYFDCPYCSQTLFLKKKQRSLPPLCPPKRRLFLKRGLWCAMRTERKWCELFLSLFLTKFQRATSTFHYDSAVTTSFHTTTISHHFKLK